MSENLVGAYIIGDMVGIVAGVLFLCLAIPAIVMANRKSGDE